MTAAFLSVTAWSMKNRLLRRFRRLREPRYLAGLVVGVLYLYWFVIRNQLRASSQNVQGLLQLDRYTPDLIAGGALLLWFAVLVTWLWPFFGEPWTFTRAEVQFFFTAPITRRQLLHYKLLRSQLGVLFGVLVASIFTGAAHAAASGRLSFVLGGWLAFSALQLHSRGATLAKASFAAPARKVPPLAWLSAAVVLGWSAAIVALALPHLRWVGGLPTTASLLGLLSAVKGSGPLSIVLWPLSAVVRPIFSFTLAGFAAALPACLAVVAANYFWVLNSDAGLERAAMAAERRTSERRRSAPVPVARSAPFRLGPSGPPETAILWKNTILVGRYASVALIVRVLIPIVVLAFVAGLRSQRGGAVAPLLATLAALTCLVGPYMMRNDLRHDLPRLPILKTWPVAGRAIVLGEMLAPTALLTVCAWFLLALTYALAPAWRFGPIDRTGWAAVFGGLAVIAPLVITGQVLIQNAAVVLFPGWIATGGSRPRGVESMGQNLLMFVATLLALALGVLPGAAVAAGLGYLLYGIIGWAAALPGALLLAAILAAEAWLALGWLGRILERTEPSMVEEGEA